jgi:hypothetical protein
LPLLLPPARIPHPPTLNSFADLPALSAQVDAATEIFEPVLNPKGWKQLFQPIDSGNMDSDEFAFLMRGAFASVLSR